MYRQLSRREGCIGSCSRESYACIVVAIVWGVRTLVGCVRDRYLPDKAIDLVDEAAARLKIQVSSKPIQLDRLDRLLLQLEMERISILGDSKTRSLDEAEKLRLRAVESQIERLQAQQVNNTTKRTYK